MLEIEPETSDPKASQPLATSYSAPMRNDSLLRPTHAHWTVVISFNEQ